MNRIQAMQLQLKAAALIKDSNAAKSSMISDETNLDRMLLTLLENQLLLP